MPPTISAVLRGSLVGWAQVGAAILSMMAVAFWTVGEVRTSTAVLSTQIKHLTGAIVALNEDVDGNGAMIHEMRESQILLRSRVDHYHGGR